MLTWQRVHRGYYISTSRVLLDADYVIRTTPALRERDANRPYRLEFNGRIVAEGLGLAEAGTKADAHECAMACADPVRPAWLYASD